jgi:hypothetical protein
VIGRVPGPLRICAGRGTYLTASEYHQMTLILKSYVDQMWTKASKGSRLLKTQKMAQ